MMRARVTVTMAAMFLMGACAEPMNGATGQSGQQAPIPDQVRTMAAAYQDLSTARYTPEDGCYWYEHSGPVETTLIPLRTPDGGHICGGQVAPPVTS